MIDSDIEKAWRLVEEIAQRTKPEWKESIMEHAAIVHDASLYLAGIHPGKQSVSFKIIALGAILHDIGRSRASRVVEHGIMSGAMIREQGFPEEAARIGETHIGVGIPRKEARALGLPEGDYIPETLEQRIVCYIDNLLYYIPEENRHELREMQDVVERFTEELGKDYGIRAREFMEGVEKELGQENLEKLHHYIRQLNKTLARHEGHNT